MTTKFPIKIPAPLHMLIALSWRGGFKLFTFIVNNLIQYERLKIHFYIIVYKQCINSANVTGKKSYLLSKISAILEYPHFSY